MTRRDGPYFWLSTAVLVLLIAHSCDAFSISDEPGLNLTGLKATDDAGSAVRFVTQGSTVHIVSKVSNASGTTVTGSLTYVVQVKDPDNKVAFISSRVIPGGSDQPESIETRWISAEQEGDYIIQVFAWQPVDSPELFAHSAITISVHESQTALCSGSAACLHGIVTRIIDGDTLAVEGVTIRLSLVNSPERGEPGYDGANAFTASVCPEGSAAIVDEDDGQRSGSYGRMVAVVYCQGGNINEELLNSENALIVRQFCDESEFGGEEWATKHGC